MLIERPQTSPSLGPAFIFPASRVAAGLRVYVISPLNHDPQHVRQCAAEVSRV
jgi:hypothetical protein